MSLLQIVFVKNSATYHEPPPPPPGISSKVCTFFPATAGKDLQMYYFRKSFFSTRFALNDVPFHKIKLSWENHFPSLKCDFSAS